MTTLATTHLPRLLFVVPDAVFMPCTQHRGEGFVGIQTGSDYEFLAYLISDLYYRHMPGDYAQTRQANCADLLLSGINAATMINAVSTDFLQEMILSSSGEANTQLRQLLRAKIRTQRMICIHEKEFGTDHYIALYEKTLNRALSSEEDGGAVIIGRDLAFV